MKVRTLITSSTYRTQTVYLLVECGYLIICPLCHTVNLNTDNNEDKIKDSLIKKGGVVPDVLFRCSGY